MVEFMVYYLQCNRTAGVKFPKATVQATSTFCYMSVTALFSSVKLQYCQNEGDMFYQLWIMFCSFKECAMRSGKVFLTGEWQVGSHYLSDLLLCELARNWPTAAWT